MKLSPKSPAQLREVARTFLAKAISCLAVILSLAIPAAAQTTGSLSGTVTDQTGGVLPAVNIVALHTPTGTAYETLTTLGAISRFRASGWAARTRSRPQWQDSAISRTMGSS